MEAIEIHKSSHELQLEEQFAPFEKQAQEWMEKAACIVVIDASQTDLMASAKEARLGLKSIRVSVDKKHKELKEAALREGQTLDKIRRKLVGLIEPIELHLEAQEKFAEVQEAKAKKELTSKRAQLLSVYMTFEEAVKFPLAEMGEDAFGNMLSGYKLARENKIKEEATAKVQQLLKDQESEKERKRLATENEKLRVEKERQDKKLQTERAERKRLEDEAEANRQKEEHRKKDEANEKRKAARAPDREKLLKLAHEYGLVKIPNLVDKESRSIGANIVLLVEKLQNHITVNANKL